MLVIVSWDLFADETFVVSLSFLCNTMIYSGGSRYLLSLFLFCKFHCDLLVFILLSTQGGSLAEKLFSSNHRVCSHAFSSNTVSFSPPWCFLPGCWNLSFSFMVLTCLSPVLMFYTYVMHQSTVFQSIHISITVVICDFKKSNDCIFHF